MIYFDNSATTPVLPEIRDYICSLMSNQFGNPSSLYDLGVASEKIVKDARRLLAKSLHAKEGEIVFTSCGSESNNFALRGVCRANQKRGRHIMVGATEHPSVLRTAEALSEEGFEVTVLPVDRWGRIDPAVVASALRPDTILVSVMLVNNELGTIAPVGEISQILRAAKSKALLHVDGVQAFGRLEIDVQKQGIDLFSLSGHKIGAPKGIGALYIKEGIKISPLIFGGGQESNRRSGTENFYYIGALAKATEMILTERRQKNLHLAQVREGFLTALNDKQLEFIVNSPDDGASHILNLSFPAIPCRVESFLHHLAAGGLYCSAGSACHARQKKKTSETLTAIGMAPELQEKTLRFSFSDQNSCEEAVDAAEIIKNKIIELQDAFGRKQR